MNSDDLSTKSANKRETLFATPKKKNINNYNTKKYEDLYP